MCFVQHLSPVGRQGVHAPASLLRSVEIMTRFFLHVHSEKSAVKILSKMKNSVEQNNYFCKAFQIFTDDEGSSGSSHREYILLMPGNYCISIRTSGPCKCSGH